MPDPLVPISWRSVLNAPPAVGVGMAMGVVIGVVASVCMPGTSGTAGMIGFAAAGLWVALWRPAAILAALGGALVLGRVVRFLEEPLLLSHPEARQAAVSWVAGMLIWAALAVAFEPVFRRLIAAAASPAQPQPQPTAATPLVVIDTSALIDGRLSRLAETGLLPGRVIVPRAVLWELQTLRDSRDSKKRARGARGLDQVTRLRALETIDLSIEDAPAEVACEPGDAAERGGEAGKGAGAGEPTPVDQRLLALCRARGARLVTTDAPLCQLAEIEGVVAVNLHAVAEALALRAVPGARLDLALTGAGEQPGQAIGHLPDGTRVIVADARQRVGETVRVRVTDLRKTRRGTLLFAQLLPDERPPGAAATDAGGADGAT